MMHDELASESSILWVPFVSWLNMTMIMDLWGVEHVDINIHQKQNFLDNHAKRLIFAISEQVSLFNFVATSPAPLPTLLLSDSREAVVAL